MVSQSRVKYWSDTERLSIGLTKSGEIFITHTTVDSWSRIAGCSIGPKEQGEVLVPQSRLK